ncbi:MAG: hypothetical protein ACYC0B_02095 [Gemmatimonadaceae bacterium]
MLTPLRTSLSDSIFAVHAIRRKPGVTPTTLSAASAAAATTMTLAATTGFTDNDPVLVGSEEDVEMRVQNGAPAGSVITLDVPGFKRAHVVGEAVYEGVAYDLGNVSGVQDGSSADVTDNETDVTPNPDGRRLGHITNQPQFDIQGYSPHLFAIAAGMDMARVLGAGTAADPTQLHTDGSDFGRAASAIVITELLANGSYLRHEWDACDPDYTQLSIAFGQGRESLLACRFIAANHGERYAGAPGFTVDSTLRATKNRQIESLLEAGLFRVLSGGLATTTTAPVLKDANVVPFTLATGVAGGKWYRIVGGGKEQILWAQSVAVLNVTMRSRLYYDFPAGSTITELEQLPFSGLKEGTTEFRVGGSLKEAPKFDNMRVQAGARRGSALFTLSAQPTARTLDVLRQSRGLPTSAISGSALIESDAMGTDAPIGWYTRSQFKGTGPSSLYFVGSGCDNGMEQLAMAMNKNSITSTPLTFRNQLLSKMAW